MFPVPRFCTKFKRWSFQFLYFWSSPSRIKIVATSRSLTNFREPWYYKKYSLKLHTCLRLVPNSRFQHNSNKFQIREEVILPPPIPTSKHSHNQPILTRISVISPRRLLVLVFYQGLKVIYNVQINSVFAQIQTLKETFKTP